MEWKWLTIVLSAIFFALALSFSAVSWSSSSSTSGKVDGATLPPTLDTPIGRFVGKVSTAPHNGRKYISYKGIPFAEPPIGALRFTQPKPVAAASQGQTVNSLQSKPSCWSVTKSSTDPRYGEDCLYVNVYSPYDDSTGVDTGKDSKFPVMVWLHGGGFVAGSAYPEPIKLVSRGQVIVVMVNYRMGVFGFLTTEDDALPSNNGLWDQYLAIKWVSENIQHLHGDTSRITVFGESSGSVSVGMHAISPLTSKYFQKGILQSGAASTLVSRDAKQRASEFGDLVGCSSSDKSFADCLRNVSVADILKNDKPHSFDLPQARRQMDFIWMPVVDGELIPDAPLALLANRTHLSRIGAYDKDYFIGVLNDEGSLVPENFLNPIPLSEISRLPFYTNLSQALLFNRYGMSDTLAQGLQSSINSFYIGNQAPSGDVHPHKVLDMAADLLFFIPALETALAVSDCSPTTPSSSNDASTSCYFPYESSDSQDHTTCPSSSGKTYFYHFDYCPDRDPCKAPCMTHGADVAYEFPRGNFSDSAKQQLSDIFVDLLTTFAKNSDPGQVVRSGWPEFEPDSRKYLRIAPYPSVRQFLYDYRSAFWLRTIPGLISNFSN